MDIRKIKNNNKIKNLNLSGTPYDIEIFAGESEGNTAILYCIARRNGKEYGTRILVGPIGFFETLEDIYKQWKRDNWEFDFLEEIKTEETTK
jgi:hypothetical protein